jgi:hypothetical protein
VILTVLVPTTAPYEIRGRVVYADAVLPLVTRVRAIRRRDNEYTVEVEAFIPQRLRLSVEPASRFVTSEFARVTARVCDNKKSLAAFLASGHAELLIPEEG